MEVVQVRFASGARSRSCRPNRIDLEVGDRCVVRAGGGTFFGVVTQTTLDNPFFRGKASESLPQVVRRATKDDEEAYAHKLAREAEAREFCRAKIVERKLPMQLGAVDQQLDGKKMVFYFTAEGRVDFRGLVRDLAGKLRMRIELRQIGARDDASMFGGCGPCGRALCCSTFLRKFEPVSVKMAKRQGLSLNPSKISGMCGRLMCCLRYEYDPDAPKPKKKKPGDGCSSCAR